MAKKTKPGESERPGDKHERDRATSPAVARIVRRNRADAVDLGRALVEAFLTNERINQVLLDAIDPNIWRAMPACSKRRNIATTFAHMHNVRCMRLGMSLRGENPPPKLDRSEVTAAEAKEALAKSAGAMVRLIESSLAAGGYVPDHRPEVVALVCAAITHDAHHRGQICHWAAPARIASHARARAANVGMG